MDAFQTEEDYWERLERLEAEAEGKARPTLSRSLVGDRLPRKKTNQSRTKERTKIRSLQQPLLSRSKKKLNRDGPFGSPSVKPRASSESVRHPARDSKSASRPAVAGEVGVCVGGVLRLKGQRQLGRLSGGASTPSMQRPRSHDQQRQRAVATAATPSVQPKPGDAVVDLLSQILNPAGGSQKRSGSCNSGSDKNRGGRSGMSSPTRSTTSGGSRPKASHQRTPPVARIVSNGGKETESVIGASLPNPVPKPSFPRGSEETAAVGCGSARITDRLERSRRTREERTLKGEKGGGRPLKDSLDLTGRRRTESREPRGNDRLGVKQRVRMAGSSSGSSGGGDSYSRYSLRGEIGPFKRDTKRVKVSVSYAGGENFAATDAGPSDTASSDPCALAVASQRSSLPRNEGTHGVGAFTTASIGRQGRSLAGDPHAPAESGYRTLSFTSSVGRSVAGAASHDPDIRQIRPLVFGSGRQTLEEVSFTVSLRVTGFHRTTPVVFSSRFAPFLERT